MSFIRKIEHDKEKEVVVCFTRERLRYCKLFAKMYKWLFPNDHLLLSGYLITPNDVNDEQYLYENDLIVLNDKHVAAINALGIDAFSGIGIAVVPKDMLFYIEVRGRRTEYPSIFLNRDRYVMKTELMKRLGMTDQELVKLKQTAWTLDRIHDIKYLHMDPDEYEESM